MRLTTALGFGYGVQVAQLCVPPGSPKFVLRDRDQYYSGDIRNHYQRQYIVPKGEKIGSSSSQKSILQLVRSNISHCLRTVRIFLNM